MHMVFGRNHSKLWGSCPKLPGNIMIRAPKCSIGGPPNRLGAPQKVPQIRLGGPQTIEVIILEANILAARLGGPQTIGGPPKGPPNADWGPPKPEIGPPNLIGGPAKYKGFPQNDWGAPK